MSRRRVWYRRHEFRVWLWVGGTTLIVLSIVAAVKDESLADAFGSLIDSIPTGIATGARLGMTLVALFLINFLILVGPLVFLGIQQIKAYEPGDADWDVKLDDVRGQREAEVEITRVVSLWQSGEEFEKAGGKRERGVPFLGPPGTGKTTLSEAIATSFNCPFVTIPGSGFAQTFIGMDAVIVRFLVRKAKQMAAKWGGQCIVFIDEIRRRRDATTASPEVPHPGLCGGCAHQRVIANTRGSVFSLCERGLTGEPGYAKYPRLPVLRCDGFEPAPKGAGDRGGPAPRGGASPAA